LWIKEYFGEEYLSAGMTLGPELLMRNLRNLPGRQGSYIEERSTEFTWWTDFTDYKVEQESVN